MAAALRVAGIVASTNPAVSTGTGRSVGSLSSVSLRVASITVESVQAPATPVSLRVAQVTASTVSTVPTLRVASIVAATPVVEYEWDGTRWVAIAPAGLGTSVGHGRSVGNFRPAGVPIGGTSRGSGRSVGSFKPTLTGTMTVTVSTVDVMAGVQNPVAGDGTGTLTITPSVSVSFTGTPTQGPPGAGSLTVTPDTTNTPPRMVLSLVGAAGPLVTIVRIDASGRRSPVRTATPATLNAGGWVGFDYEAPFGQTVRYQVTNAATDGGGSVLSRVITSDPVRLDPRAAWLIHPGIPDLSQPLKGIGIGDMTRPLTQSVQYAIGRENPVVNSDGIRHAPTFDLTVKTTTFEAYQGMLSLLHDGSPLLLQVAYPFTDVTEYWWVAVADATEQRRTRDLGDMRRRWTLPCTVTDPPSGLLQAQRTWSDALAEFDSWQDVVDTYPSWRDVITDTRVGG
jgi:hypothetical protein